GHVERSRCGSVGGMSAYHAALGLTAFARPTQLIVRGLVAPRVRASFFAAARHPFPLFEGRQTLATIVALGADLIVVDAHDRLLLVAGFRPRRFRRTIEAGGRSLTSPDAFAVFVNGGLQGIDALIDDGGLRFGAF